MSLNNLIANISKTGFVLENKIAQQLKIAKWTVISNRYYIDDAEESVREIDLVAYKASRIQHFDVYTTLIISCKKSDENVWALLARDIDLKDPNSDWQPLHAWTNDKALAFQLDGAAKRYHETVGKLGTGGALQTPLVEVFAFQEMNKRSGAPKNDRCIFAAVTSLMKAQAHELGALPQRKRVPAVYQFNLLSVVDAELVRLMFSGETVSPQPVATEHYIARYIIRKRETFARIRFIHADAFGSALGDYGALHSANCQWFNAECNAFYKDIVKDGKRMPAHFDEFRKKVRWELRWPFVQKGIEAPESESITVQWSEGKSIAQICGPFGADGAKLLNGDQAAKRAVGQALESLYRYTGAFEFADDDIPF